MIITTYLKIFILCFAHSIPSQDYKEEKDFLENAGFGHLVQMCREEEVEIGFIPRLDNVTLRELGFNTIGQRMRIRDSATTWLQSLQVSVDEGNSLNEEQDTII